MAGEGLRDPASVGDVAVAEQLVGGAGGTSDGPPERPKLSRPRTAKDDLEFEIATLRWNIAQHHRKMDECEREMAVISEQLPRVTSEEEYEKLTQRATDTNADKIRDARDVSELRKTLAASMERLRMHGGELAATITGPPDAETTQPPAANGGPDGGSSATNGAPATETAAPNGVDGVADGTPPAPKAKSGSKKDKSRSSSRRSSKGSKAAPDAPSSGDGAHSDPAGAGVDDHAPGGKDRSCTVM